MKILPYVVLVIAIAFTLWSMVQLQGAENSCNEHLKSEFEQLMESVEKQCPLIRGNVLQPNAYLLNVSVGILE